MTSPLEIYSKFVLANHFCSAKSWNWSENGQWPTAISGSVIKLMIKIYVMSQSWMLGSTTRYTCTQSKSMRLVNWFHHNFIINNAWLLFRMLSFGVDNIKFLVANTFRCSITRIYFSNQVSNKLVTPKLRPTIDIDMVCFIKSSSFTCCKKSRACFSYMTS